MRRVFLLGALASALLYACATDVTDSGPTEDGGVVRPDSSTSADADAEAGSCEDCEHFPDTCTPDVLCPNGPFDPSRLQGGSDAFDLRTQINAIAGRGENDVWAVGNVGALAHFDGTSWKRSALDTLESIRGIRLFASGELAYGATIDRIFVRGIELENAGASDAWSSGQKVPSATGQGVDGEFTSVWARPDAKWTWLGTASLSLMNNVSALWRMRQRSDKSFELAPGIACTFQCKLVSVVALHGSSRDVLWTVGSRGATYRITDAESDSPQFELLDSLTWNRLNGVWAASDSEAWAVGASGTVRHVVAGSLQAEIVTGIPLNADLRAVSGTSLSDIWAVGDEATVIHYDGKAWSRVKIAGLGGRRPDLTAIWIASPGHVWIGGQGVIVSLGGRP